MTDPRIDPSNVAQFRAWDGDDGAFWAERADRFNEGVSSYSSEFFDAAAILAESDVLDIGCGSGQTTREAGRRASAGSALGVDLSAVQLQLAEASAVAEGLTNVEYLQADAQVYPFSAHSFDLAISRHGAMFFGDPAAAFSNIRQALRPSGRLTLLTWQPTDRNEWMQDFRSAFSLPVGPPTGQKPRPGSLSDPDQIQNLLSSSGFEDIQVTGLTQPMYFGADVDDAANFITGQFAWVIEQMDLDSRVRSVDALRAGMTRHHGEAGVTYSSAAWLIQARAGS